VVERHLALVSSKQAGKLKLISLERRNNLGFADPLLCMSEPCLKATRVLRVGRSPKPVLFWFHQSAMVAHAITTAVPWAECGESLPTREEEQQEEDDLGLEMLSR